MEGLAVAQPQRHLEHVEAVVLLQPADAVFALAQLERVVFARFFNHGFTRMNTDFRGISSFIISSYKQLPPEADRRLRRERSSY
ncbi:MAG: hypothetical protein M5U15_00025 [Kiritimatiellae bacterium]|nr:hypothetical protein [Kiritimatiellia bacterium]